MAPKRKSLSSTSTNASEPTIKNDHKEASPESPPPEATADSELSSLSSSDEGKPKKKKQKKVKAAKVKKGPVVPLDPELPINVTLPDPLSPYLRRKEGTIRISAWNVCGLKSAKVKGMLRYLEAEDADILVLTETKMDDPNFEEINTRYPHRYWGVDPNKKGYSGTAILSKVEPMTIVFGLPTCQDQASEAGRCVTLEFANCYLIGTYVPNAGADLKTLPRKNQWNTDFKLYLSQLDVKKPVIWCGDLNVVPAEKDIRNWKTNYNKSAGCTDDEIDAFKNQLAGDATTGQGKMIDVWRKFYPEKEGHYTYYSYKFQCRVKGIGWRLDHFVVSERIIEKVKQCEIRQEIWGASDHVPIILDIEGPL